MEYSDVLHWFCKLPTYVKITKLSFYIMTNEEIIKKLTEDAQEWGLEYELNEFLNDNPNLTATEIDEQFRNEWDI